MHAPLEAHGQAVKRVLLYLDGTLDSGLIIQQIELWVSKDFITWIGLQMWMKTDQPQIFVYSSDQI